MNHDADRFFDWHNRFRQLDAGGDPLPKLKKLVDWERFRPELEAVRDKERKSNAGRKPFDVVLMFKVLVLQSLYNLSDEKIEFQIRDRISFMRFLDLSLGDAVPDEKTIWLFREQLAEAGLIKRLFQKFDAFLGEKGYFLPEKGKSLMPALSRFPGSAIVGRRTGRSKRGRFRRIGRSRRSVRRIPMLGGRRRTDRTTTVTRIISMSM